jgi:circadian clock protein KaiB
VIQHDPTVGKSSSEATEPTGHIRLYIAGRTPSSLRAQKNLSVAVETIAKRALQPNVEIIDVFAGPKRAISDGIFVTPTLIAQLSNKRMMMVGDLSDTDTLGSILDAATADTG